jgi:hypothetical protein
MMVRQDGSYSQNDRNGDRIQNTIGKGEQWKDRKRGRDTESDLIYPGWTVCVPKE